MGVVRERIDAFERGEMSFADFVEFVVHHDFKEPARNFVTEEPFERQDIIDDSWFGEPDTYDEISSAWARGVFTSDQREAIDEAYSKAQGVYEKWISPAKS